MNRSEVLKKAREANFFLAGLTGFCQHRFLEIPSDHSVAVQTVCISYSMGTTQTLKIFCSMSTK